MLTKQDLIDISKVVKPVIQEELKPIKKDLQRIEKKMNYMVDVLDKEILKDRKRIDKLEKDNIISF
ncbi:hypothetical protein BH10PAT1_BH10PAT1_3170 [soil metagenome]